MRKISKNNLQPVNLAPMAVFLSLTGCFIYLLSVTWLKWGDLLIDTFRDPLVVLKIFDGKILYKDIFYPNGFLPPYALAFICKVFGFHLDTLVGLGIVITILMSVLIYKISRFFLDEVASGLAVFTYLFICAFGFYCFNGIFNFILPYCYASALVTLFIFIAMFCFLMFISLERYIYLFYWSIAILTAFFSRPETTLPVWVGFVSAGVLYMIKTKVNRWGMSIFLAAPFVAGVLGYILFLSTTHAFAGFKESFINVLATAKTNPFIIDGMGLNEIPRNISLMAKSLVLHICFFFGLGTASYFVSSFFLYKDKSFARPVLGVLLATAIFGFAGEFVKGLSQYRFLPFMSLIAAVFFFIKAITSSDYKKEISLFALSLISFIMLMRMMLRASPLNYGFYVLDMGLVFYYVIFFYGLRGRLERRVKHFSEPLFFSISICFFMVIALSWWRFSLAGYRERNLDVRTPQGRFISSNYAIHKRSWEAIAYLLNNAGKNAKVIVIPEGGGINFFSGTENPLRYYNLVPSNFAITDENSVIDQFRASRADYIVITQRDTTEYGAAAFGIDYARSLYAWIKNNYELVKLIGPYPFTTNEFGIAILKKK